MKLYGQLLAVFGYQPDLGGDLLPSAGAALNVFEEDLPVMLGDEIKERIPYQRVSFRGQHPCTGEIDLLHKRILVQGDVPQRREVVKVDVPVAVAFQLPLDIA